jgi:ferredoxin
MTTLAYPGLLQDVRKFGTFDANACADCGSCTVACTLSNGHAAFPRRPMQLALLGLKIPLLGNLDPWLCHDCGECSTTCPRQAEPRESMMTLRRYLSAAYDVTGLSAGILSSRAWATVAAILVGTLVFALAFVYHLLYVDLPIGELASTSMGLEHMFDTIIYFTYVVFALPIVILVAKAVRMDLFARRARGTGVPFRFYAREAWRLLPHLAVQPHMAKCTEPGQRGRWAKHLAIVAAFAAKSLIVLFFLTWFQTDALYPLLHPQRWVGYCIAAILILLPLDILVGRFRHRGPAYRFSEGADFRLPVMLLLVALSGIAVHVFRYVEFPLFCHYAYALHLAVATALLLVEVPFGKLSHVILRPVALYLHAVHTRGISQ